MQLYWRYVGGCAPPRFATSLEHVTERIRRGDVPNVRALFVAIGTDVGTTLARGCRSSASCWAAMRARRELLEPPELWRGRLVTSRMVPKLGDSSDAASAQAWGMTANDSTHPMYIEESLVDLTVCRRAAWLVGWSSSSFSLTLARYRALDHGEGWWSNCQDAAIWRNDGGLTRNLCNCSKA